MSAKRRVTGRDPCFGGHRRLVLGYRLARVLAVGAMIHVAYYRIARHHDRDSVHSRSPGYP